MQPHSQRVVTGDESVEANVELAAGDEVGVADVTLDYVGFGVFVLGVVAAVGFPLCDFY